MGITPALVANLSWYKDMEYSYKQQILEDFSSKRHLLLQTDFKDCTRDVKKNMRLASHLVKLRKSVKRYREQQECQDVLEICKLLEKVIVENRDLGDEFIENIREVKELLGGKFTAESVANMEHFKKAWGRGTQYICVRKIKEF